MSLMIFICGAKCQENENFDKAFINSFSKNFRVPNLIRDSCIEQNFMLRVYFDQNLNLINISFSDNSVNELKEELKLIIPKLDFKPLIKYLKWSNQSNINFIYPIAINNEESNCLLKLNTISQQSLSYYSGKLLSKPCILRSSIQIRLFDTIKKLKQRSGLSYPLSISSNDFNSYVDLWRYQNPGYSNTSISTNLSPNALNSLLANQPCN